MHEYPGVRETPARRVLPGKKLLQNVLNNLKSWRFVQERPMVEVPSFPPFQSDFCDFSAAGKESDLRCPGLF